MHHVEPEWEHGLNQYGTSLDEVVNKIARHLEKNEYDKIILTRFCDNTIPDDLYIIADHIDIVYDYGYSWESDMFDECNEGIDFCAGGNHSQVVELCDWQKDLVGHEVNLCGAFDGECIEDMEIALSYLKVNYNRLNDLIV